MEQYFKHNNRHSKAGNLKTTNPNSAIIATSVRDSLYTPPSNFFQPGLTVYAQNNATFLSFINSTYSVTMEYRLDPETNTFDVNSSPIQ